MPPHALLIPIFVLIWLGIAATRVPFLHLDRPGCALLGAVALLATGLFTLEEAFRFVDWSVIAFLLGMMVTIAHLEIAGFFELAARVLLRSSPTPGWLLVNTSLACAVLSALFVNDTICLLLTPIVLAATRAARLAALPFLIAIATSSNIGSALTITGNPQNMFIGVHSGLAFLAFARAMAVPVAVALVLECVLIRVVWQRALAPRALPAIDAATVPLDRVLCTKALLALGLTFALFVVRSRYYPQAALLGGALCLLTGRADARRVWHKVDWTILLFFAGIFVVMGAFQKAGYAGELLALGGVSGTWGFAALAALLSNLVSNVPAVILMEPLVQRLGGSDALWLLLAASSTFAGNFTLIASVANLIVAEKARAEGERMPFLAYLAIGVPLSVVTVGVGVACL